MKTCLIIGDSDNVQEDLGRAFELSNFDHIIAVKRVLSRLSIKIDAWVSLHAEMAEDIIGLRIKNGFEMGFDVYTDKPVNPKVKLNLLSSGVRKFNLYKVDWGGSSGLYGVQIALKYFSPSKIVLAGIPIDSKYLRHGTATHWAASESGVQRYQQAWLKHRNELKYRVKSLSGWTKDLLGHPSKDWFESRLP